MSIFDKWENEIDLEGLMNDLEDISNGNTQGDFKEVPCGVYEVSVQKMELKESKKGDPMLSIWFNILEGEYKNSKIFYNQVLTNAYGIHSANEMLRALVDGTMDIDFKGFKKYADLILDVHEMIDREKWEFGLAYGQNNKGFNTYKITEIFEG